MQIRACRQVFAQKVWGVGRADAVRLWHPLRYRYEAGSAVSYAD
jgi:hypothetical protein